MIRTIRPGSAFAWVAICLLFAICGCHTDRATFPTATVESSPTPIATDEPSASPPAQNVPAEAQAVVAEPNEAERSVRLVLRFSLGQASSRGACRKARSISK